MHKIWISSYHPSISYPLTSMPMSAENGRRRFLRSLTMPAGQNSLWGRVRTIKDLCDLA